MRDDITPKQKKQKIDILNDELYFKNKEFLQRKRRKIHGRNIELKHSFKEEDLDKLLTKNRKRKLPTSIFRKIFLGVLFFFIITAVIAVISLYDKKEKVSDDLISMEILGQPFIDGGENLELHVRIQNFNKQKLILPDLILSYPKDSSSKDDEVFLRRSLSDIESGKRINEEFNLLLYGKEGDVRNIHATLEYRIEGSSSIFVKKINHELVIRSTPTKLSIDAPKEIVQNQEIQLNISVSSNTNEQINDILLSVNYPLGFEFISSNIKPKFGSNIWYFPKITSDEEVIKISGRLDALPGQGQSFQAKVGKQNQLQKDSIETTFDEVTHTVDIKESFITADISANNKNESKVPIRGGDNVNIEIEYKNNLDKVLNDVQVTANLNGDLYIPSKVLSLNGDYNSNSKNIIWDKNNVAELESLNPGESGTLNFNLDTKDLVSSLGFIENPNFTVTINVSGIEDNGNIREASSISRVDVLANSDLSLIAKTSYSDGPFKNSGPIPPRVGEKTKYTVTLQILNSSNDIKDTKVITTLPSYVTWTGNISPSVERSKIDFNKTTREVKWDIGDLQAGVGIGEVRPRQVSFQVELLPSLSHVDTNPDITRNIILSGRDTFTDVDLSYKKTPLTTRLSDSSAVAGDSRVVN